MGLDEFLHNSLNDFDAGFDEKAWKQVSSELNTSSTPSSDLKSKLENFDAGYDKSAWNAISGKVANNNVIYRNGLARKKAIQWSAGAASIVVGLFSAWFLIYDSTNNIAPVEQAAVIESKPIETASDKTQPVIDSENIAKESTESYEVQSHSEKKEVSMDNAELASAINVSPNNKQSKLIPVVSTDKSVYCFGEEIQFVTSEKSDNTVLRFGGKKVDNASSTIALVPGKHKLELWTNTNGKNAKLLASTSVEVLPRVEVDFKYSKDKSTEIPSTSFKSKSDYAKVEWFVGSKSIGTSTSVNYVFKNRGKHLVKMVAETENGCKDSSIQTVRILKAYNLMATQVYNPQNGTWLPVGLKMGNSEFDLQIISSDGERVFRSSDKSVEWDGRHSDSNQTAKQGDEYFWVAKVTDETGKTQEYGGSFIINENL